MDTGRSAESDPHARDPPARGRCAAESRLCIRVARTAAVRLTWSTAAASGLGADGRGDRLVARSPRGWFDRSPEGTRLAFASTTGDGRAARCATTLDVTPRRRHGRTLFVDPARRTGRCPTPVWSPDRKTIAFGVGRSGAILGDAATGGAVRTLTRGGSPRSSPHRSTISFTGSGPAGVQEAETIAAGGRATTTDDVGRSAARARPGTALSGGRRSRRRRRASRTGAVGGATMSAAAHFGSHGGATLPLRAPGSAAPSGCD